MGSKRCLHRYSHYIAIANFIYRKVDKEDVPFAYSVVAQLKSRNVPYSFIQSRVSYSYIIHTFVLKIF